MFSFLNSDEFKKSNELCENVVEELKRIYNTSILPLEEKYLFHKFHLPPIENAHFEEKPMILLVGPHNTGKSTFLRYLLRRDPPGIQSGATDRFTVLSYSKQEGILPGSYLDLDPKQQFRSPVKRDHFFYNSIQCTNVASTILKQITLVDTPGILLGGYEFTGILEWFAERADRIVLFFDSRNLVFTNEFKSIIEVLYRQFQSKIRFLLNKVDMFDQEQLLHSVSKLAFSLGKVLDADEVPRIFIGSFIGYQPLRYILNQKFFEAEKQELYSDIISLPCNAVLRKVNYLIKRARLAKAHACIIGTLRKKMPLVLFKGSKKKNLIKNLSYIFFNIETEFGISKDDLPDTQEMQGKLIFQDFTSFPLLKMSLLDMVEEVLAEDLSKLKAMILQEQLVHLKKQTEINSKKAK